MRGLLTGLFAFDCMQNIKETTVTILQLVIDFFLKEPFSKQAQSHPRRPRGSQSGAGEMARRKFSRTGGRTPGYQVSPDHFQTALRIPAPDWTEKIPCIILPNQEPVFAKPIGNGPVRLGTQGFFRPFLKTFVAPFRPPPSDCPWVSEDGTVPAR